VAVISALALTANVAARPPYVARIPNGRVNVCATCHVNPAGTGPRNPFGQAVEVIIGTPGERWGPQLALQDSDGDGISNGAELQDPKGGWTFGGPPPGDRRLVSSPGFDFSTPGERALTIGGLLLQPTEAHGLVQAIQIRNTFNAPVDAGGLWLFAAGQAWQIPSGQSGATTVAPGGTLVIFVNGDARELGPGQLGEPSQGGLGALNPRSGFLALHWRPDQDGNFGLIQTLVDYVQWGAGQPFQEQAARARQWDSGAFVPAPPPGALLVHDGQGDRAANWRAMNPSSP
jgi:hypothetical protein